MTHNEELLLKDLCSRLPYGVKVEIYNHWRDEYEDETLTLENYAELIKTFSIEDIKPYLFPLSSMTDEQYEEFKMISGLDIDLNLIKQGEFSLIENVAIDCIVDAIDWFNENHFDYRELILLKLAKDATNLNIYQL